MEAMGLMEPIEILKLAKIARECKCWAAHRSLMAYWHERIYTPEQRAFDDEIYRRVLAS